MRRTEKLILAGGLWVTSLFTPIAFVGVDWVVGWRAFAMALKDGLSIGIVPGDPYVRGCLAATVCNAMFWAAMAVSGFGRRARRIAAVLAAIALPAGGYAVLAMAEAGLLAGVHVGSALWLGAPLCVIWATVGRSAAARRTDSSNGQSGR